MFNMNNLTQTVFVGLILAVMFKQLFDGVMSLYRIDHTISNQYEFLTLTV